MIGNRETIVTRLSMAALALDLLVVFYIAKVMQYILHRLPIHQQEYLYWLALPAAWVIHLFLAEIILGGRTIGRSCLGLSVVQKSNGQAPNTYQRIKRFLSIVTTFGIHSLNPTRLPPHNRTEALLLLSDIVDSLEGGQTSRHILQIISGPHSGSKVELSLKQSAGSDEYFNIGRDVNWAHLQLPQDQLISAHHCRILAAHGAHYLIDYGRDGKGSTNHTFLKGKKIGPNEFHRLASGDIFQIGSTRIKFT